MMDHSPPLERPRLLDGRRRQAVSAAAAGVDRHDVAAAAHYDPSSAAPPPETGTTMMDYLNCLMDGNRFSDVMMMTSIDPT